MQREHIETVQQQMRERRSARAAQANNRRKKPASAELPKVLCTDTVVLIVCNPVCIIASHQLMVTALDSRKCEI